MAAISETTARAHCYVCDKVERLCLCDRIVQVDNRTPVHIVQHRTEHRHPFGSVRIARLGLSNVTMDVVRDTRDPLSLPDDAVVLYPDPGAPVLSEIPLERRPRRLIVIDGTWSLASKLRRHHPALAGLPAVTLPAGPPSRYKLRSEPSPEAISSLEAIVRALRLLEPDTLGLDGLIDAFDALNEDQLAVRAEYNEAPRQRRNPRVKSPPPAALTGDPSRLVLFYAELHQPKGHERRFMLRITAVRPTEGLLLDVLVESPVPPSEQRVANMKLPSTASLETLTPEALAARLRALTRPTDTLVSWSQSVVDAMRELGLEQPFLSAKHYFGCQFITVRDDKIGSLDDIVRRWGLTPTEPLAPGRGGRLLSSIEAVIGAMRQRAERDRQQA